MNGVSHNVVRLSIWSLFCFCLMPNCLALAADETNWPSLSGRVVIEGPVPKTEPLDLGRDSCCIEAKPTDQRWLVGAKGGLANVVISLKASSRVALPLPSDEPSDETLSDEPIVLTNRGCSFSPRIILLRSGQTLRIANEDPTTHNVAATLGRNASFNLVLPPEDHRDLLMEYPERKPMPVACNIHPYMRGYVSVRNDPYVAITNTEGNFVINKVPTGTWEFQFWHEGRYLPGVSFVSNGKEYETDARGRIRLEIEPGKPLDLGDLRMKPLPSNNN